MGSTSFGLTRNSDRHFSFPTWETSSPSGGVDGIRNSSPRSRNLYFSTATSNVCFCVSLSLSLSIHIHTYMCIYLRASGSGRRPQRRMARLQISGHYAYPAVRSDLTPAPHFCPRATACIECHADSLSCPLTQLYIPGVPGGVHRGSRGSRGFA